MRKAKHRSFRRMITVLREFCPPLVPVKVRRRPLSDCLGYTSIIYDKKERISHFNVVIDNRMSWEATWQILIHEWAHCIAWHEGHETVEDHGPEWALAVAKAYQESVDV